MQQNTKIFIWWGALLLAAALLVIYLGNRPQEAPEISAENVKISSKAGMGNFLVDAKGMTLYYFLKDTVGKSNCYNACANAWPSFYKEEIKVSNTLNASDFATVTRADGTKQTAYKGWPIYYYYQDFKPGDTNGEGIQDVWYIAPEPFYTLMAANKEGIGNYLVDPDGMALYYFMNDVRGDAATQAKSNCTGICLANWPLFHIDEAIAPSLLKNGDFSEITRADGSKQSVYKGRPLYYYIQDTASGDVKGEGFGNVWFLVKP